MKIKSYLLSITLTTVLMGIGDNHFISNQLETVSVSEAPVVDGNVMDDPVWEIAPVVTSFTQQTPDEGESISEKTEVRVMYSSEALYVAVVCFDSEPERIVVSDTRRDASLKDSDSFRFILDTFHDKQNGYIFGTNPAGIEYDAQVNKEGQGGFNTGRQSVGAGGAFNLNWDAVWEVQTVVGDFGWSAEFAIPFKTLRFKEIEEQQWGINFERVIARKQEDAYWIPIPRQFNINRVSIAGTLTGLVITNPKNLKIIPYGLGQTSTEAAGQSQLGLDAKYSLTSSLTLDFTYNTDFAQVEADEKQINLDRFSLFFPEKRSFFLENAGLFSVGEPTYYGPDIEMFFSRRIGIGPGGSSVPILGGARLTGTAGGLNIGVLNMQT
ncbi:MAG TPA: hydrolase, partial [Candidatus Marinimicrobia bacterium]|nr:hydrolase [Candidatus Neomarinimicrobiota bacterium]